ncbi:MAG: hypothetical protein Q9162_007864 [Coniocarpon cinnabarinum]
MGQQRQQSKRSRRLSMPAYEANVISMASDRSRKHNSTLGLPGSVKNRIKSMLARGDETRNTSQQEAETAMRMATRLMNHFNVKQADILQEAADTGSAQEMGGFSEVKITRSKHTQTKRVVSEIWVSILVQAVRTSFDCKAMSTRNTNGTAMRWTFYGIAENTEAAATAFQMVFTVILHWAYFRRGSKNSYYLGVAGGLRKIANDEKHKEARTAAVNELQQRASQAVKGGDRSTTMMPPIHHKTQALLANGTDRHSCNSNADTHHTGQPLSEKAFETDPKPFEDDLFDLLIEIPDDDTTDSSASEEQTESTFKVKEEILEVKPTFDEDDEMDLDLSDQAVNGEEASIKQSQFQSSETLANKQEEDLLDAPGWQNSMQLQLFRRNANAVADDVAKSFGRIRSRRKANYKIRDYTAYQDGLEDSKKVDMRRNKVKN